MAKMDVLATERNLRRRAGLHGLRFRKVRRGHNFTVTGVAIKYYLVDATGTGEILLDANGHHVVYADLESARVDMTAKYPSIREQQWERNLNNYLHYRDKGEID